MIDNTNCTCGSCEGLRAIKKAWDAGFPSTYISTPCETVLAEAQRITQQKLSDLKSDADLEKFVWAQKYMNTDMVRMHFLRQGFQASGAGQ